MKRLKRLGFQKQGRVLAIRGGFLAARREGTTFHGKGGRQVFFPGARFSTRMVASDSAYQFWGTIHISKSWASSGFDLKAFAHEYGHYLQQQEWGTLYYFIFIAIPSVYSAWFFPAKHHLNWYEQDATARGKELLES